MLKKALGEGGNKEIIYQELSKSSQITSSLIGSPSL